eukprot:gene15937-18946_t
MLRNLQCTLGVGKSLFSSRCTNAASASTMRYNSSATLRAPLRIALVGAPGSGKGTQSAKLEKDYGLRPISTGQILRQASMEDTELGRDIKAKLDEGRRQAEDLDRWLEERKTPLDFVIYLEVPEEVLIDRIQDRWIHPASGRVYNSTYKVPRVPGFDDETGEPLVRRSDDNEERKIKDRIETYHRETMPILTHYKQKGKLVSIYSPTSDVGYESITELFNKLLGFLLSYIKQPPVISEVITGIILGPSVLGLSKAFSSNVFPPSSLPILNVFANVGLIFFMFMIGLEVDPKILQNNLKSSMIISLSSIIAPFAMGIALARVLFVYQVTDSENINFALFAVFVGVAISITAFPVLARILTERGLMTSKVGITSLAAASVDDVIAWILLAFVVSFAKNLESGSNGVADKLAALWTFILLFGFVIFMGTAVRWGLIYIYKRWVKTEVHKHNLMISMIMLMFICAFYTEVIGVHAIFGAFILGVVTPRIDGFHHTIIERIQDIVTIVLLPLYFTFSGLRTSLGSINSGRAGGLTILIIVVACVGKIGGATLASRFTKNSWRESITVGFLMNTKGLVELIVLNIGLDIKVLDQTLFTMFVVMALATTFMTTPIVHFIWTTWERKQAIQPMAPRIGKFNILIYPSQSRIASVMTSIAASICSPMNTKKKYKISAIYATEVTGDRPSTYFFNNIKSLPPGRREVYESVETEAANIGVVVKPILMNSVDIASDICHVAKRQWPDLVLLGWSSQSTNGESMSQSMDNFTDSPFYGNLIITVLQSVRSCVGIVIDKGLDRFHKQHNVLFPYTGAAHELDAFTLIHKMSRRPNMSITIVTNHVPSVQEKIASDEKLNINHFNFIHNIDPYTEVIDRSKDSAHDYWLIVAGVSREDASKQEKFINTTQYSLLIIHPSNSLLPISAKNGNSSSMRGSSSMIEMAPSIIGDTIELVE